MQNSHSNSSMAHRQFKDNNDREWEVWDVRPASVADMLRTERSKQPGSQHRDFVLPSELRDGWLAFQSKGETRRLVPIPNNWEGLSDAELEQLVVAAQTMTTHVSETRRPYSVS